MDDMVIGEPVLPGSSSVGPPVRGRLILRVEATTFEGELGNGSVTVLDEDGGLLHGAGVAGGDWAGARGHIEEFVHRQLDALASDS